MFLLMVAVVQVTVAQETVQIPAKDVVLNTLKEQHPRLISAERVAAIKQVIQEDDIAKQIWNSNCYKHYFVPFSCAIYNKMV